MPNITRRDFLGKTALAAGALAIPPVHVYAQAASVRRAGPNDSVRVAVAGVKGRGGSHVSGFASMPDVGVAAIVDIDENVIDGAMKNVEAKDGKRPTYYQDFRKMLEDKSIDAVTIATCNHTHTLLSIWAIQAGKHVYVEKPLSHNVWEGRQLVKAARKYDRCVQHGTQSRSSGGWRKAVPWVQSGKLGAIKIARGLCYKRRGSIGKTPESPVPKGVDYDAWLGPAPVRPFTKNRFHYNWHWMWDTGCGDIGNQGVHEMDKARWTLGKGLPNKVICLGGRFGYEDDGETPNTQIVVFDYGDSLLTFEVRGLETDKLMGVTIGNIGHCENGNLINSDAQDKAGKKVAIDYPDQGGGDHFRNFIDAIKAGKPEMLHADVLEGHLSSALCHLANISYRLGELKPVATKDPFGSYEDGNDAHRRMLEHLTANKVDLEKTQMRVGPLLTFDPKAETFPGNDAANKLLTREYRKPYVVPENP
jgi:predicted dehydrogenase